MAQEAPRHAPGEFDAQAGLLTMWWCNSDGWLDQWDQAWMAVIGEALRANVTPYIYLRSTVNHGDLQTLDLCRRLLEQHEHVDSRRAIWVMGHHTNSVWIRDYGPLFAPAGSALAAWDARYHADRPLDDAYPEQFAALTGMRLESLPLALQGGNLLANGGGVCIASDVVLGQNPELSETEVQRSLAVNLHCPRLVIVRALEDPTGHVDMWLAWLDATTLLVGQYRIEQDPINHAIIEDNVARRLSGLVDPESGRRISVQRVPMPSNCPAVAGQAPDTCPSVPSAGRIFRSYLNVVPLGESVVVPVFNEHRRVEGEALAVWQGGGRRVRAVESDHLAPLGGGLHCITRNIPVAAETEHLSQAAAGAGVVAFADGAQSAGCSMAGDWSNASPMAGTPILVALGLRWRSRRSRRLRNSR